MHQNKHPKDQKNSFIRLKIFEMYKNGHNYFEIARHFKISSKAAESFLLSYIHQHKIDVQKLEETRALVSSLSKFLNNNSYFHHGKNESLKEEPEINELQDIILDKPTKLRWFSKLKTNLCYIVCFWK